MDPATSRTHHACMQAAVGALQGKTVQVGQFHVRLDALLGRGGYADIYCGQEINSGQTYALKHLLLQGDAERVQDVQREARTMAKLRGHRNVLRLYSVSFAGPKEAPTDGFFLMVGSRLSVRVER